MEDKKNIINKNASYNIIKNVCAIVFPLVTLPYISRVLGTENTGKINFSLSVVSYFMLLASLGVNTYAVRECAAVRSDKNKLSKVASQIFSINILSTFVSLLTLIFFLIFAEPLRIYQNIIIIQSTMIVFSTLGTEWVNTAIGDFKYITIRTILIQLLSLIMMFVFVRSRDDYIRYVYISVMAASGSNVMNIFHRRKHCDIHFLLNKKLIYHIKPIMMMFSLILAQTVFVSTDTTILGLVRGDVEVGLYGVSTKIYNIVNSLIASIAWVVMPELTELFQQRDFVRINPLIKYSLNMIVVLGIPAIVGLNIMASDVVLTLAGEEYLEAIPSLRMLTLALVFSFAGGFVGNIILLPSKKEGIILASSIISAIVY